ncbi:hypothetical protein IQ37_07975 [Chryseobacterium piperi]|uniref:Outer membrane protein beta-barrel domain-containing protein n=1 Tax=Chryseobacterium piperi TaxID=558152 RepID=A0A086BJE8_9FLAO|nr:hypothetical protein [Chryseobacterium piperi]ASW74288.1 hypothetical protein CJF12_08270 [Chryseobacterium piperi]KFF29062.1 hypothetical protein IQ37_07975 [Chryseobacterium piperi]
MKQFLYACGILISGFCFSQKSVAKVKASFFDGVAAAGYVDHGAFINCTGPNISLTYHSTKLILGMLPSLRIKEDQSDGTRNSAITPNLGAGLTFIYKKLVLQIPLYYNSKTSTQNGSWKMGIGLGYSLK